MENKKLLKFLLNDLSELDELVSEKGSNGFDELEMEFIQTRIKGVKKLIQILYERENASLQDVKQEKKVEKVEKIIENVKEKIVAPSKPIENIVEEVVVDNEVLVEEIQEEIEEPAEVNVLEKESQLEAKVEEPGKREKEKKEKISEPRDEKKVELNEEESVDEANNRLGDSAIKEKSVNDLMGAENTKLEHKLSNRPVANIQASIGINDRFQYIRELFDGKAETFTNTVKELDAKKDIKEAVEYLQQNFKWKKNETSLKFVNLVKRRFSNE
jgi:hypothetical protein